MQNPHSDFEYLLQYSQTDDPRLLTTLVQVYGDVAGMLVKSLFHDEASEAILETIFLKASQNLDQYPIGSNFKIWFLKLAVKVCRAQGVDRRRATLTWPPSTLDGHTPADNEHRDQRRSILVPQTQYYLPLVLRYCLNLSVDEISTILRIRKTKVLDRLNVGIERLMEQAIPNKGSIPLGPGNLKVHHNFRKQAHQLGFLTIEDQVNYQDHLSHCPQCRQYQDFLDKFTEHIPFLLKSATIPYEKILGEVLAQADKNNGSHLGTGKLRRPGQEIIWVVIGVGLVLGIGWIFNRINPLIEVQQAIQARITPTLMAPLEPFSGEVRRVSTPEVNTAQTSTGTESSWNPRISGDGGHVVFTGSIRHLVEADNNGASDIFLYEMETGGVERISISSTGEEANNGSYEPGVSRDGRLIVFTSWANNLTQGDTLSCEFWNTQSSCPDIFLHDRNFGTTTLISGNPEGNPGDNFSFAPEISQDGNLIVFWSAAGDLVPDDTETCGVLEEVHNCVDLFLYDLPMETMTRIPIGRDYTVDIPRHYEVSLSGDGDLLLLTLNGNDRLGIEMGLENPLEVFLYQRDTGIFEPVNQAADGTPGNESSFAGNISANGRWVVWASLANNLAGLDLNDFIDIFLRDRVEGTVQRISQSIEGGELDGDSGTFGGREGWFGDSLSISEDGQVILFGSTSNNLAPDQASSCGVATGCRNVFLYDRRTAETIQLNPTNLDFIPFTSLSSDGNFGTYMAHSNHCLPSEFCLDIFVFNRKDGIVAQLGSYGILSGTELSADLLTDDKLTLDSHSRWVVDLSYSPDGQYLASGSRDQSVKVWSVAEERQISQMDGEVVAFSPDSALLAAADDERSIYLWRNPEGQLTGVLNNEVRARDLAFSPDGTILAVAGSKGVNLWDLEQRVLNLEISIPGTVVRAVAISPDGQYLAAATDDHTIWIKSFPEGYDVARLGGHNNKVVAVTFSPDGTYLATGSNDNAANLWRLIPRPEGSMGADLIFQFRHQDWVTSLAFSPDGQILATGSFDNSVAIWDVLTGELLDVPYRQTQNQVLSLAFSPDGNSMAAGNVRGEIHYWRTLPLDRDP